MVHGSSCRYQALVFLACLASLVGIAVGATYPPAILSPIRPCGPTLRGQAAHFSVYVSGKAPFTYAWKFNNTVFSTKASSLTYDTIDVPADYAAEGNYSVTVTNVDGNVSSGPVALDVIPGPPVVMSSLTPVETFAIPDEVADMHISMAGYKPMTFQWKKDGRNFGAAFTNSTGEASLKLRRVPASNGNYSCTVTNADGSLTTPAAHVGFWATPTVRLLNTLVLTQYNYFSIEPTVISTEDPVSYQWQFNGVNIPGATEWRLDRSAANVLDLGGSYRVIMRTAHHTSVSNSATVVAVVNNVPGVVRAQGSTVVLKVPGARPGPSYLWRRDDGKPLSPHCSGIKTPTLTITKADMDMDSADYHCLVYLTDGSYEAVIGGGIHVAIVKDKPQFVGLTDPSTGEALVPSTGEMLMKWGLQLEATNQPTKFAATGLPPGLSVDSKTGLVSGAPVKAGEYHVTFSASNPIGTTTSSSFVITISPSDDKHLSGTWVGPVAAIYSEGSSLCSCSVTVTPLGGFTGKVWGLFGGTTVRSYSFSGAIGGNSSDGSFDGSSAFFAIPKSSLPPCSGAVSMYLKWSEGYLTGQLIDKDPYNNVVGEFYGFHKVWAAKTNPAVAYAGAYSAELAFSGDPSQSPKGSGYATFTVLGDGTFTFAGKLPDGSAFAIPSFVDATGAAWVGSRLYAAGKGVLEGTMVFASVSGDSHYLDTQATGDFHYIRPGSSFLPVEIVDNPWFYGVNAGLHVIGARYLPPGSGLLGSGSLMMNASTSLTSNLSFTLTGGDLLVQVNSDALLNSDHTVTFSASVSGEEVKPTRLAFTAATGLFSGAFTHYVYDGVKSAPVSSHSTALQGVVVRDDATLPQGRAAGFHVTTQTLSLHPDSTPNKLVKVTLPVSGGVAIGVK